MNIIATAAAELGASSGSANKINRPDGSDLAYHYTPSLFGAGIIRDGVILTSENNTNGCNGLVWFSTNPVREKTAAEFHPGCLIAGTALDFNFRFGIQVSKLTRFAKLPISPGARSDMLRHAFGANPAEWYAIKGEVPMTKIQSIEWNRNGVWVAPTKDDLNSFIACVGDPTEYGIRPNAGQIKRTAETARASGQMYALRRAQQQQGNKHHAR